MSRTGWLAAGIGILAIVVLMVAIVVAGRRTSDGPEVAATATPSAGASPTATSSPGGGGAATGAPGDDPTLVPTEETLAEQVERVSAVVADIRGHGFDEIPDPVVLDPDALEQRVREEIETYTVEEAELDGLLLAALGVLEPGSDVRELLISAYGEQVAGFYDPDTGELVVGATSSGDRLGRLDELTLAHELEHALADQIFGLPGEEEEDAPDGTEDDRFARQSLIEGDATVTMSVYVQVGLSQADRLLLLGELDDLSVGVGDTAELPYLLQRQLEFPYVEGANFVGSLVNSGGWPAVDAAYEDPPTSSAQILDPQRYVNGVTPDPPASRGTLPEPWSLTRTSDLGAADLLYLFEAPGDDTTAGLADARPRALAWTGGTVDQWVDGDRHAVGIALTGDFPVLCDAMDEWYSAAFPDAVRTRSGATFTWDGAQQDATLTCGGVVRFGIGPDLDTAGAVASGDG